MNLTIFFYAAGSFEGCLKVLMLSTAVSDDLCYGLCVFFVCVFLRPGDKVTVRGYKNRVFYASLDGTK